MDNLLINDWLMVATMYVYLWLAVHVRYQANRLSETLSSLEWNPCYSV